MNQPDVQLLGDTHKRLAWPNLILTRMVPSSVQASSWHLSLWALTPVLSSAFLHTQVPATKQVLRTQE